MQEKRGSLTILILSLYNLFCNRVNRMTSKAKKCYYTDYFAANVNNIKKTWEGIR